MVRQHQRHHRRDHRRAADADARVVAALGGELGRFAFARDRILREQDRPAEIHEAVGNLRRALQRHQDRWSPEEILRIRDLLNDTAKAISDGTIRPPVSESSDD